MTELEQNQPIRGAIKTAVSASTENLVAGQEFSIFVQVQNPFEVPLVLHRVSTYLPTEFIDIDLLNREERISELQDQIEDLRETAGGLGVQLPLVIPRKRSFIENFTRGITGVSFRTLGFYIDFKPDRTLGPAIARSMPSTTETTFGIDLPLVGKVSKTVRKEIKKEGDQEAAKDRWKNQVQQEINRYEDIIKTLSKPEESGKPLQPGNSTTRIFTVKSRRSIWFKPSSYRLNIEVEYEISGVRNIDTIEHAFHVRSSLPSMIFGSMLGGLFGWFASKGANISFDIPSMASLFGSLVLAAMSVVLFARKKDVQPLIAIEDFWGGLAVGFLVAYSGPRLIGVLLGRPESGP